MNIFQIINVLAFSKKKAVIDDLDAEGQQNFIPYMVNRWLSFYSKGQAQIVNMTLNRYTTIFDDKNKLFKLFYHVLPQVKFKRISYVKKIKKDEKQKAVDTDIRLYAINHDLSVREVEEYIALQSNCCK